MADPPRIDLYCEDSGHEQFARALLGRITRSLGHPCPADPGKCERDAYKRLLRQTIQNAGQPILTSEMEYAPDLVSAMDLFRAGKTQPSLKHFMEEIRKALQSLP